MNVTSHKDLKAMKRYGNIIDAIIEQGNMSASFDDVLGDLKNESRKAFLRERKQLIIDRLAAAIRDGSFRITHVHEMVVTDGPKRRVVQAPPVIQRIGCHAIMRVVDQFCYKSIIPTSAASIKGRGMHYLHKIVADDLRLHPDETTYFYKCDIKKFYETIDQDIMFECVCRYIKDKTLLPILENFVRVMPSGLAIGLRSSQCFGNILLDRLDHFMKEVVKVRYYYRYCDDIVMLSGSKKQLWLWRDILIDQLAMLKLTVKDNEVVRPVSDGLDFLGFVHYGTHSLVRKRTKKKFARHMAKVKSRKRRIELMGAFKGMAAHGDCNHLYYTITGNQMKKFSEMGVTYTPADGKKRFPGKMMRLGAIVNKTIEVHDYESGIKTSQGEDRYVVSFFDPSTKEWGKFFTASDEMKNILDQISDIEDGFPFETVIVSEVFDGNKVKYKFS